MPEQSQLTVLIVDPQPHVWEAYWQALVADEAIALTILNTRSAEAALEHCLAQFPDLVLTELVLPGMDGLELLTTLQTQMGARCPAIILVTDQGDEELAVQAIRLGAEDYWVKCKVTVQRLQEKLQSLSADRASQEWDQQLRSPQIDPNAGLKSINESELEAPVESYQRWENQRFIHQVIETAPGIVYIFDLQEQRNIYSNRQVGELLGYTPEQIQEMGNQLFAKLMHPDDLMRLSSLLQRFETASNSDVLEAEFRMRNARGEWRWLLAREMVFRRNADGSPRQVVGNAVDITQEDGYSFIRRVRSLPSEQGGQIPAAALTAYAREGDRLEAIAAGFQMHVPKPIEPIQLLTVVTRLATRHLL